MQLYNKTAQIVSKNFHEFLDCLDTWMIPNKRAILPFISQCPTHPNDIGCLKDVQAEFLHAKRYIIF
jgi:hypothetical protein